MATTVEVIELPSLLKNRPSDLACLGIDIPIGLLDDSRACDKAARKLLGLAVTACFQHRAEQHWERTATLKAALPIGEAREEA